MRRMYVALALAGAFGMVATAPSGASAKWGPVAEGTTSVDPGSFAYARELSFANGTRFDPLVSVPAPAPGLAEAAPAAGTIGYYLVQGKAPLSSDFRGILSNQGAEPLRYHPTNAYVVRATPETVAALRKRPEVRWVGLYHTAYRLSPALDLASGTRQDVLVTVFDGVDMNTVESRLASLGGSVEDVSINQWNHLIVANLSGDELAAAAAIPGIDFIEPKAQMHLDNDRDQWVIQTGITDDRRVWDMGITGTGEIVTLHDSGIDMNHCMFEDPAVPVTGDGDYPTHRKVIAYKSLFGGTFGDAEASFEGHGTHTSCTIAGNDDGTDPHDGMAKDARLYFTDGGSPAGGIWLPADLNTLFNYGYTGNSAGAARISSNSWGGGGSGTYSSASKQVDQFMWNHPDFLICFSAGNDGPAGASVHPPSTAKDCICAGAVGDGATGMLSIQSYSSRGPTADGRLAPTVCAPGQLVSANHNTACGMQTLSGTSMACPSIAGGMALVREYLNEGWYPSGSPQAADRITDPSAALMKAMAVNSGNFNTHPGAAPGDTIGWGRILLDDVLYFAGDARQLLLYDQSPGLSTGHYDEYTVYVYDATQPLEVTLAWTDYYGNPSGGVQLVNNLNLTATDGIDTYLGNNFVSGQSVTGGSADNLNPVEGVVRNTPTLGAWTIRVTAANAPQGPQPYALVVTGGVSLVATGVPGASAGPGHPAMLALSHGPNPVVSSTVLSYTLPHDGPVDLTIYDVAGRAVRTLVNQFQEARDFRIGWDARDNGGRLVPSGIYFARLHTAGGERVDKLVVTR